MLYLARLASRFARFVRLPDIGWAMLPGTLLKLVGIWFLLTALLFWKKPRPIPRQPPGTRFACLVPARNEERVIGALVESLKAQRYPGTLFDIYVIPNHCTDGTVAAAQAAGARVFSCAGPVGCKGDALRQACRALLEQGYDAFCVFDADNLVHPDFLARMNDALCSGAAVAKARTRIKNPYGSWVSGCYALYYGLCDEFYNRSRANLGLSARLVGTGFAVHRSVLEQLGGWNTATMAEDAEFSAMCTAAGTRVHWVPEALTLDEAPQSFRLSLVQRRRWTSGIMDAARRMCPALCRAIPVCGCVRAMDGLLFLLAGYAQALSPFCALLSAALALRRGALPENMAVAGVSFALGMAAAWLLAWAAAGKSGYDRRQMPLALLLFPLFMASWLPLQCLSLLRRCKSWKAIPHTCA